MYHFEVDYLCIHYCIWLFFLQLVKLVKAEKFSSVPPLNYNHGSCSMVSLVLPIAFSTAVTIVILVISRIILWSCRTVVDYLGFTRNSSKNSTFTKPITLFKSHIKYVTSLSCHRHDKNEGSQCHHSSRLITTFTLSQKSLVAALFP